MATLTRRALLQSAALAASGVAAPFVLRAEAAAGKVTPTGKMTLAWHTNIAPRWLDPGQHDGSATPDNFINVAARRADQELQEGTLRPSGAGRAFRVSRGRQERHVPAAPRSVLP